MRILGQVSVYPTPDPRIARLKELAYNLWWSWHPEAQALYSDIDPVLWAASSHNPVRFLRRVSQHKLDAAAADSAYVTRYQAVVAAFDAYMHADSTWFSQEYPDLGDGLVAYFSAEFGLHEALPIYSGGLGILAGDHCKSASDLGVPMVGVGFLYPQGYFQQRIDGEGRQQAISEKLDFTDVPATAALGPDGREISVSVELPGRTIYAKVWRIQVGRIAVFLLDTDVDRNAPADRELAARLYGGNQEMRISQEVVLGIGGVRMLRALGLAPTVWHMNEGHAAFLQLERLREYVAEGKLVFPAARWMVRSDALFTTHTPVPAGNDAFPFALMDRFFGSYWARLGLDRDAFMNLGRYDSPWGPQFSMTVLALHTAGRANGVSQLHGAISRKMWRSLWPGVALAEVPIQHVTNGVHTASWLHPVLKTLLDRHLGPSWDERLADPETWRGIRDIPRADLWAQHNVAKKELIQAIRARTKEHLTRVKADPSDIDAAARLFDPHILTIGFARRFATYKRAALVFRDPARLQRILHHPQHPVQIVFAGKAHPADEAGKALIQTIYQLCLQPEYEGRIVFVEDYDINLARLLVAGVDLWLNTPRRPLEASGTSGQKAGLNGALNFSVQDGWWTEGYNGDNGWAIGETREYTDEAAQDDADALSLYRVLEEQIVPLYYERDESGIPLGWEDRVRSSIASIAPAYSLARMLGDYLAKYYAPLHELGRHMQGDAYGTARLLADWERRVEAGWPSVSLEALSAPSGEMRVGQGLRVSAALEAGSLGLDDLVVELVVGRSAEDELSDVTVLPMRTMAGKDGRHHFEGDLIAPESGVFSYGVRVRPHHPHLPSLFVLPHSCWAH